MDYLGHSLKEQEQKVNEISTILAPLSPSGTIPGLTDPQVFSGEMLDLDQIFNSGEYFNDGTTADLDFGAGGNDLDFTFDSNGGGALSAAEQGDNGEGQFGAGGVLFDDAGGERASRVVETAESSLSTSPANTVDENFGVEEGSSPGKKRRRKG